MTNRTQTKSKQQLAPAAGSAGPLSLPPEQKQFLAQIKAALDQQMTMLEHLLPSVMDRQKFVSNVMAAIVNSKDGKLFKCDPHSVLKAAREAVEFGLSLNPQAKQADLIPRWNGKTGKLEAQFQIRYGGLITLARRSGEIKDIYAHAVREGDTFGLSLGLDRDLKHIPKLGNKGPLIAAYCVWILADGTKAFEPIDQEDIDRAKRSSQSRDKETGKMTGPWDTDEEEMWRKTAIRKASKYMPSSAEDFQKAVQMDTLRDVGHEVEMQDGEIIDITEATGSSAPIDAAQTGNRQMDNLEDKIAGGQKTQATPAQQKQQPAQQQKKEPPVIDGTATTVATVTIETTAPVKVDGEMDYAGWIDKCIPIVKALPDQAARDAWQVRHAMFIENADFSAPDKVDDLNKAIKGEK